MLVLHMPISHDQKKKIIDALCSGDVAALRHMNVHELDDDKRFLAIFKGFQHVHFVEYMLEQQWPDLLDNSSFWIMKAIKQHPLSLIEQMCQYCTETLDEALIVAVKTNREDTVPLVKLLVPHSKPTSLNSKALQYASVNHNLDVFDLLYEVSDPVDAMDALQQISTNPLDWMMIEQRMEAERIHEVLQQNVEAGVRARERKI